MKTIDERYQKDPVLRRLVDVMRAMIRRYEITPSEIREAAMLAQLLEEMENPRPMMLSPDLQAEIEYRTGGRFRRDPEPNR